VSEAREPPAEVIGQVVVEDPGADLEQKVGSPEAPVHLLLLLPCEVAGGDGVLQAGNER
jgi:hypothetical protein